jgi:hypothetical protein
MSTPTAPVPTDEELEALYATRHAAQRRIVQGSLRRLAAFCAPVLPGARWLHLDTDERGLYIRAVTCEHGERLNVHDELPAGLLDPAEPLVHNLEGAERMWRACCSERDERHGTYTLDLAICAVAVGRADGAQVYTVVGAWAETEAQGQVEEDEEEETPEAWIEVVQADNPDQASSMAIALQRYAHAEIVGRRSERDGYGCEPYPIAVFEGGMQPVRK